MRGVFRKMMCMAAMLAACAMVPAAEVRAAAKLTPYDSPYAHFSPTGTYYTLQAGEKINTWLERYTTVYTGRPETDIAALSAATPGTHTYEDAAISDIPVSRWVLTWPDHLCIHGVNLPPGGGLEQVDVWDGDPDHYIRGIGDERLVSGWEPYCAECGVKNKGFHYALEDAVASINYLPKELSYYYICPYGGHFDNLFGYEHHHLRMSYNMYEVRYETNAPKGVSGYMPPSRHTVGNVNVYDGEPITPQTRLSENQYHRDGYVFKGWDTKPDGSGRHFDDMEEIHDLCKGDINRWDPDSSITLYAQWEESTSTLELDPNGGSYDGNKGISSFEHGYGETFTPDTGLLTAPAGVTVHFDTDGAGGLPDIQGTMHFDHWDIRDPQYGIFSMGVYTYGPEDGVSDRITAQYVHDPITLPDVERDGFQFQGWYWDRDHKKPAGRGGSTVTPTEEVTFYAAWGELKLYSDPNYDAFGGTGAADLMWELEGGTTANTYKLYQSGDGGESWQLINTTDDIKNGAAASITDSTPAYTKKWTVPYTGLYRVTGYGAQGGNFSGKTWDGISKSYTGGKGGDAWGLFWLEKGEVLTYSVGGQDGRSDTAGKYAGGKANNIGTAASPEYVGAAGGGATYVESDRQGLLLVAAGGGGASLGGSGNPGGSSTKTVNSGAGASGGAGGGGGYKGGDKGDYDVHAHQASCFVAESGSVVPGASFYANSTISVSVPGGYVIGDNSSDDSYRSFSCLVSDDGIQTVYATLGSQSTLVATPYSGTLSFDIYVTSRSEASTYAYDEFVSDGIIYVYDQSGKVIYSQSVSGEKFTRTSYYTSGLWCSELGYTHNDACYHATYTYQNAFVRQDWQYHFSSHDGDTWCGHETRNNYTITLTIPINEDTEGVYMRVNGLKTDIYGWAGWDVGNVKYVYSGQKTICGKEQGQVISASPSYGGTNFVDSSLSYGMGYNGGTRSGNGQLTVASESVGYTMGNELDGVKSMDKAAPDPVDEGRLRADAADAHNVTVSWEEPKDNGTEYWFRAESYMIGADVSTQEPLHSNLCNETLTSGIAGYRVLQDEDPGTMLSAVSGTFQAGRSFTITDPGTGNVQWLHIAAVDVAGNISMTVHTSVDFTGESGSLTIGWPIHTEQLEITGRDNNVHAHPSRTETYYVRADGVSQFVLTSNARMDGLPRLTYMIGYMHYALQDDGSTVLHSYSVPYADTLEGTMDADRGSIQQSQDGASPLAESPDTHAHRSDGMQGLQLEQAFRIGPSADGKELYVYPRAGAQHEDGSMVWSDNALDAGNGITLIPDAEAPVIHGMDLLNELSEDPTMLDRLDGSFLVDIWCEDDKSGVRDLVLEVENLDNHLTGTFYPDADGHIIIEIVRDDHLFGGDFSASAVATDNVGNVRRDDRGVLEFALEASITRILEMLEPRENVFRRGESGWLDASAWGYADRITIEFPDSWTALDPSLDTEYVYDRRDFDHYPEYLKKERWQFMVPLYLPLPADGSARHDEVIVTAYKDGRTLTARLPIAVVDGTVLDMFRDRLRAWTSK